MHRRGHRWWWTTRFASVRILRWVPPRSGLDAAADRHIGLAEHDVAPSVSDAFGSGGAGRDRGDDPCPGLALQTDGGRGRVGHVHLDRQRRNRRGGPFASVPHRRREVPRWNPCPCRSRPSAAWDRLRAHRRLATRAGSTPSTSSAGTKADAARCASAHSRNPPAGDRRCGREGRTPRRTNPRVCGYRCARQAVAAT